MSDNEIKYTREALIGELDRICSGDNGQSIEEATHIRSSVEDLDSTGAPDAAYTPLLARAQGL